MLPNFIICGAQKSGTTALYYYLRQHPDVFMSRPKETGFFCARTYQGEAHYEKGLAWLASHFEEYDGERAVGEATARTMATPEAPARIASDLPEARLIFLLRDPVERAYSQYHFYLSTGKAAPDRSFCEIIRDESSALRQDIIQQGLYEKHLARFDKFFERSQIKILLSEHLKERRQSLLEQTFTFIGVNPHAPIDEERRNVTRYPKSRLLYHWVRSLWQPFQSSVESYVPHFVEGMRRAVRFMLFDEKKPPMELETRAYLSNIYADPNDRLASRIERDLSHWG